MPAHVIIFYYHLLSVFFTRYAVIKEIASSRDRPVCGGIARKRNVYLSVSNSVEVHIVSPEVFSRRGQFLLYYEGELRVYLSQRQRQRQRERERERQRVRDRERDRKRERERERERGTERERQTVIYIVR